MRAGQGAWASFFMGEEQESICGPGGGVNEDGRGSPVADLGVGELVDVFESRVGGAGLSSSRVLSEDRFGYLHRALRVLFLLVGQGDLVPRRAEQRAVGVLDDQLFVGGDRVVLLV